MKHAELISRSCLMDDEYMSVYFKDNKKCTAYMLTTLLKRKELEVVSVRTHNDIVNLENRSVILDIYAVDKVGKVYDIEIQRESKEAHPKRARYYSSIIDASISAPGDKFKNLTETWVIFVIDCDYFKQGLPLYTIDRSVSETGQKFEDEAHIVYVNGKYRGDDEIGRLIHDLYATEPDDMLCPVLREQAYFYKHTEGGVRILSEYVENQVKERYGAELREKDEALKEAEKARKEEEQARKEEEQARKEEEKARKEAEKARKEKDEALKEAAEKERALKAELEEAQKDAEITKGLGSEEKRVLREYADQLRNRQDF